MAKRDLTAISHAALTDHRIVRVAGEAYAEAAFHLTTPELPGLIHLNRVPAQPDTIPTVTLLAALAELMAVNPGAYQARYRALLDQAAKTDPANLFVLSALAHQALLENKPDAPAKAMQYLSRATQSGSTNALDYLRLGALFGQAGRLAESASVLEKGLRLAPYNPLLCQALAMSYFALKKYDAAAQAIQKGLDLLPDDAGLRALRGKIREPGRPAEK